MESRDFKPAAANVCCALDLLRDPTAMASTFDLFPWFKNFTINPVTDWERFINPQFNVTVNQGDAAIENHVLARAGSYGKQIGRMQEVLDILIARLPPPALSPIEERSIEKYQQTRGTVVDAVEEVTPNDAARPSGQDIESWLDQLAALRSTDPARFERYAGRLKDFLARQPSTTPAKGGARAERRRSAVKNRDAS